MAKAAYTAQFLPWSTEDLLALDVPLNRTFRRLLLLPPSHPNALLYIGSKDGGLGLPRLSDQINLRSGPSSADYKNAGVSQPSQPVGCYTGPLPPRVVNSSPPNRGTSSDHTLTPLFGEPASEPWARIRPSTSPPP